MEDYQEQKEFQELTRGGYINSRYEPLEPVGEGAFGRVYKCRDHLLGGSLVALKVSAPGFQNVPLRVELLAKEVRSANRVVHDHVVRFYEFFPWQDRYCISMEFVEGETLRDLLKREAPVPVEQAAGIIKQCCHGLQAIHDSGVLHRDLKPANIMINAEGFVKITDFGIAEMIDTTKRYVSGMYCGTLLYCAPEILSSGCYSVQSDIYALGVMLYQLLTGITPWSGLENTEVLHRKVSPEELPAPGDFDPECPAELSELCMRMMAWTPGARCRNVATVVRGLNEVPEQVRRVVPPEPAPRLPLAPFVVALVVVLLAAVLMLSGILQRSRQQHEAVLKVQDAPAVSAAESPEPSIPETAPQAGDDAVPTVAD